MPSPTTLRFPPPRIPLNRRQLKNRKALVSRFGLVGQWYTLLQKITPFLREKAAGPSCTITISMIESREKALQEEVAKNWIHSSERVTPTKCLNTRALASLSLLQSWTPHKLLWIPPRLGLQVTVPSSNLPKPASVTSSHLLLPNGGISYRQPSLLRRFISPDVTMILCKRTKRSLYWNPHPALILAALTLRVLLPGRHLHR